MPMRSRMVGAVAVGADVAKRMSALSLDRTIDTVSVVVDVVYTLFRAGNNCAYDSHTHAMA